MPRVLIIDDEPNVLYSLEKALASEALEVVGTPTARQGLEVVRGQPVDAVVLDVRLPDMGGLDAFLRIQEIDPRLPVIIVTAFAATETAIEAMKRGAYDFLLKPINLGRLREVVARAVDLSRLRHVPAVCDDAAGEDEGVDRIVGRSGPMQEVYKAIGRVAAQDVTVLVTGESGTGKELVARALYHHSRRRQQPFLALNCAAIPETLLESELFGHERGAFTGAERRRIGKFEQAHRGTLFLDEIGDMTPATQSKMLRLLQEQRFERLGGEETLAVDVRVIAATNKNLEQLVAVGRFREDLFYRLKVFSIHLPPLRERLEDLPLLVAHFVKCYGRELGKGVRSVLPEVLRHLGQQSWPGNVRELQNTIKRAMLHATGDVLPLESFTGAVRTRTARGPNDGPPALPDLQPLSAYVGRLLAAGETDVYRKVSLELDRLILESALRHTRGNQLLASELLGIARSTLRTKLRALGMGVEKPLPSALDVVPGEAAG